MHKQRIISNELFRLAILSALEPAKNDAVAGFYVEKVDKQCDQYAKLIWILRRMERKLHRLYERNCNGAPDYLRGSEKAEAYERATEKLIEQAEKKLADLLKDSGITLTLQRDPRGGAIRDVKIPALTGERALTDLIY